MKKDNLIAWMVTGLVLISSVALVWAVAPTAPARLHADPVGPGVSRLEWNDTSGNETSFKVYRSLSSGTGYSLQSTTTANITQYTDTTGTAGTTYWYKVLASNADGDSSYTAPDSSVTSTTVGGGQYVFAGKFGESGAVTNALDVAADGSNNIAVVGQYFGTANFGNSVTATSRGGFDGFVVKYNSSGVAQWAKDLGGSLQEAATTVKFDAAGNVLVGGWFSGTTDLAGCGSKTTPISSRDGFLVKLAAANGNCTWQYVVSGDGEAVDYVNAIDTDGSNNVYITGGFFGTNVNFGNGITLSANVVPYYSSPADIYVAKLNSSGVTQWARGGFGNTDFDQGTGIDVDTSGNVYVTGDYGITVNFGTGAMPVTQGSFPNGFLAKWNNSGTIQWAKSLGDNGMQKTNSVATDSAGNVIIATWVANGGGMDSGGLGLIVFEAISETVGSAGIVISKYTPAGVAMWQRGIRDAQYTRYPEIAVNSLDEIYFTTEVYKNIDVGKGVMINPNPARHAWLVAKYRPDGSAIWSKLYQGTTAGGGEGDSHPKGIAVTSTGVVTAGWVNGDINFGGGTLDNGSAATPVGAFFIQGF